MKLKPLNDRLLVKRIEKERNKGGIIVPDTAKEKPTEGRVIAAGPGRINDEGRRVPLEVKVGNRVLFGKFAGTEVNIDEVEHVILREDDVLGIIQ
ncbi:MAG: co-chaperone GroES [Acidobacteriota bacterium]|nr:co-chaperone GroES [Acidobacteriota bacterium]